MSFGNDSPSPPLPVLPNAPSAPPMFGESQAQGMKPKRKSQNTTFLGSAYTPVQGQLGTATLLGQ